MVILRSQGGQLGQTRGSRLRQLDVPFPLALSRKFSGFPGTIQWPARGPLPLAPEAKEAIAVLDSTADAEMGYSACLITANLAILLCFLRSRGGRGRRKSGKGQNEEKKRPAAEKAGV